MVAEPWLVRLGLLEPSSSKPTTTIKHQKHNLNNKPPESIGILSFEVANILSKTVHLHKSLTNPEISNLKTQILTSAGVKALVSNDETYLLDLALSEKLDDVNFIAGVVSRLGKKCTLPQLRGFQHVYADIVSGAIEFSELGFLVKDMDGMIKKMERYVNATARLYAEMEVLNQLEVASHKFQQNCQNQLESKKLFEQKVAWQKQDVKVLKDVSLWNQSFDKVVEMLARTVCTLYTRVCVVFDDAIARRDMFVGCVGSGSSVTPLETRSVSVKSSVSGSLRSSVKPSKVKQEEDFNFACGLGGSGPGRLFMECLNRGGSISKLDDFDDGSVEQRDDRTTTQVSGSGSCSVSNRSGFQSRIPVRFEQQRRIKSVKGKPDLKNKLVIKAGETTIGGSGLALHYANVIIVIEKLLQYPHLVGEEARDDLYQMLPTSLRLALRAGLKSYVKDLAIYDAPLAHDWKDRLDGILAWLAPMAHNMIRWQNERNFEQQQIVSRTNVLLLQTLYFADRIKTEAAICELLVGLNYICRYEHQQNALLDCASSFDFEECVEWQTQY